MITHMPDPFLSFDINDLIFRMKMPVKKVIEIGCKKYPERTIQVRK
jgi:hypothetical protein